MKKYLGFACLLCALAGALRADYILVIGDVSATQTVHITFNGTTGSRLTLSLENSDVLIWTTQSGYNPANGTNSGNTGSAEALDPNISFTADGDGLSVTNLTPGTYKVSISEGPASNWFGLWSDETKSGVIGWTAEALFFDPIEQVAFFYFAYVQHDIWID